MERYNQVSIDEMLTVVGEYGFFQKMLNFLFCVMAVPCIFPVMILYFAAQNPAWKCASNSSICSYNGSFSSDDQRRCLMPRDQWEYTVPKHYSLVTQFDLSCKKEWMIELATSTLFIGWIFGAGTLGWFADNYGRKLVIFVSIGFVMIVGLLSAFMPTFYLFVICRFVVGFFLPGTFPNMFILISENVGCKHRAFCGLSIYVSAACSLSVLCLEAYFIRNWKILFIICNAPYIFVLLFYKFVPESVCYLRIKNETTELRETFETMARWNKNTIPRGLTIIPVESHSNSHKSNPLELFRTTSMAYKTSIQAIAYFVIQMSYYGVYIAAGAITGHMYRDYLLITVIEIPLTFLTIYLIERLGTKITTMASVLVGAFACTGLGFTPEGGSYKILRIVLALVGKCSVSSGSNTIQTWTVELYDTSLRGEAMGFMQVLTRAGAATAPWMDKEFAKVYFGASFLVMGVSLFCSFFLLTLLPGMLYVNDVKDDTDSNEDSTEIELHGIELAIDNKGLEMCD